MADPVVPPNATPATDGQSATPGNGQQAGATNYEQSYTNLLAQLQDPNGPYVKRDVYVGLQRTHQQEFDAHQTAKKALQETSATLATLQGQVTSTSTTLQQLQNEKTTLATEKAQAEARVKRFEIIGKEFPELVSWEAQGLLPMASPEDLPTVLKGIQAQLQAKGAQSKTEALAGASVINSTPDASVVIAATAASELLKYNNMVFEGKSKRNELDAQWQVYQTALAKETTK